MVNVTLWPDTWARLRGVVRRHALLLVDGELQREGTVVNVVAHDDPAARRGGRRGRRARSARTASARSATPGCAGWADRARARVSASGPSAAAEVATGRRRAPPLFASRAPAAVRVRQLQEPAIPRRAGGEQRAEDRREQERRRR